VGSCVRIITYFQIIDPHKVREFIIINEPFLKKLVEEIPRERKGKENNRKIDSILALSIITRIEVIAWRKIKEKLSLCNFQIEEGG